MKMLSTDEILEMLGVTRACLHNWRRQGKFPQPLQLGPQKVAWKESEVQEWLEGRPRADLSTPEGAGRRTRVSA